MGKPNTDFIRKNADYIAAGAILLMVLIAYIPAMMGGYVWDDDMYVTQNPLLTMPNGMQKIWFSLDSPSQYFPLVYTMFRMEYGLWGLHPFGYHLINVLIHALNAILLWWILRKLRIPGAWLAAALWALHPVNVESVAWITERKNTLSTFFYMLSILGWMRFLDKDEQRKWLFYGLSVAATALALFAKTTACTIPAALVIILWLRKERLTLRRMAEISPYVILGVAMGIVSIWWEKYHQGTLGAQFAFTLPERFLIAGHALWFYLGKVILPIKLTFSYPQWKIDAASPLQYLWLVAAIGAGIALWKYRSRIGNGPLYAGAFFAATLAPMLGFISLYTFRYTYVADHYQYVACIAPIVLFAAFMTTRVRPNTARYAVSAVIICLFAVGVWRQGYTYKDLETMWNDILKKNPASWMAHEGLGVELYNQGFRDAAMDEYREALRLNPEHWEVYTNLGALLDDGGKYKGAIAAYDKGLKLNPGSPKLHFGRGNSLSHIGQEPEAIREYETALKLYPEYAEAHCNLAVVLANQGKLKECEQHLKDALAINPNLPEVRANLKAIQQRQKDLLLQRKAAAVNPAAAKYLAAMELHKQGKIPEAIQGYQDALKLNPNFAEAHSNLGLAYIAAGKYDEALKECTTAIKLKPDLVVAHNNLAVAYYMKQMPSQAWDEVHKTRKLGGQADPSFIQALTQMMPEPR